MLQKLHPTEGPNGFTLHALIYPGGVGDVAVGLMKKDQTIMLGLRWCAGNERVAVWPGEETGWFLIPFTFAAAIGQTLAQLQAAGYPDIDPQGFKQMTAWLVANGGMIDAICY